MCFSMRKVSKYYLFNIIVLKNTRRTPKYQFFTIKQIHESDDGTGNSGPAAAAHAPAAAADAEAAEAAEDARDLR